MSNKGFLEEMEEEYEAQRGWSGTEADMENPFPSTYILHITKSEIHEDENESIDRMWVTATIDPNSKDNKLAGRGKTASATFWRNKVYLFRDFCRTLLGDRFDHVAASFTKGGGAIDWVSGTAKNPSGLVTGLIGYPFISEVFQNDRGYATFDPTKITVYHDASVIGKDTNNSDDEGDGLPF